MSSNFRNLADTLARWHWRLL